MKLPAASRTLSSAAVAPLPVAPSGGGAAEALFRTKRIPEIRATEAATRREIAAKEEELRQLVGRSYRDLIDSADSILLIKRSSDSISANLAAVSASLKSLSPESDGSRPSPAAADVASRSRLYAAAARVKYLVDSPEHIWGCLDELMLLEAAGRYLRAGVVHSLLATSGDTLARFPVLAHQWQLVGGFRLQISQRGRDRLAERSLPIAAYADALSAVTVIENLTPEQSLDLFLDSRRSWILQCLTVGYLDPGSCSNALCDVMRMIRLTLGQVGQLFVFALNEMPLFYKTVLELPPGTQLFGGIPNPEDEVRLWKAQREKLDLVMALLEPEHLAHTCCLWLHSCCDEIFGKVGRKGRLIEAIVNGEGLATGERLIHETLDNREGLDESLEMWLRNVFGSEIESPWNQIRSLILKDEKDILENRLEQAFMERMKEILYVEFNNLGANIKIKDLIEAITAGSDGKDVDEFKAYLRKDLVRGGVWFSEIKQKKGGILAQLKPSIDENDFQSCLSSYLGSDVSRIRDGIDNKCRTILEDLLSFVESNNSTQRLKVMAPFLQEKCYKTVSGLLEEVKIVLDNLSATLDNSNEHTTSHPSVIVERSLFVGRLLFALQYHSNHVPLILGSPRQWVKDKGAVSLAKSSSPSPKQSKAAFDSPASFTAKRSPFESPRSLRQFPDSTRRQTIAASAALFGNNEGSNVKLDELHRTLQSLCIRAHSLWITWVAAELSNILSHDLNKDDALSSSTSLRGWEVTVVKQDSADGPLEMQISLPSMPSPYIISLFYQACLEIHKIGGHILDKTILQNFAWELLHKVVGAYQAFSTLVEADVSRVSDKGALQMLLDLRFVGDILSGGKSIANTSEERAKQELSPSAAPRPSFRWKQAQVHSESVILEPVNILIKKLSERLDPIDWATYEPYLWENEKQAYKRYGVLFGFLFQLNRQYTDTVQKLPRKSNSESNIMRCSQVPKFKYLPISAPALASRGSVKSPLQASSEEATPRSPWKSYSNAERSIVPELDDSASFGSAAPLLKSFMTQVGSKFGEGTSRLGSMLSDGQVSKFKDRSAAAMYTIGDILPGQAAGLLSSLSTYGSLTYSSRSES